jgi:ssDNA-binding Zn-finger/Zn-ribbon topoisomerase 1
MAQLKLVIEKEFTTCECSECGIEYAVKSSYRAKRRNDHATFYCPNGHSQYILDESEAEKLKRELADTQRQLAAASERATTNYRLREKAERELKKVKRRTSCGVCPECNRTFVALGRHMKTKHPDFTIEARL